MLEAVGRTPGVQEVAAVSGGVPLTGTWSRSKVAFADERPLTGDAASIDRRAVTPNYLSMLGIRVLRGRHLDERDRDDAPLVAIVNESAARLYWPGADPLGARIRINSRERTVVGVVNDIRHLGPEVPPRHEAYLPLAQERTTGASLVIRTTDDAMATLPAVRAAIWSVNPNQRLYAASPSVEGHLDRLIAQRRFIMVLFVVFGVVAVCITGIGLYGMLSYLVTQRTPELGIRLALGAQRRQVVSLVARHAASVTGIGAICGLVAVWRLRALVDTFLFGVDPLDRGVLPAAVGLLALVAVVATCAPAYRASRLDPLRALRFEQ